MPIDFSGLDARLLSQAETVLFRWFPNGRMLGGEFCIGSLKGEAGRSLKFNVAKNVWSDFAAGDGGAGLISLYAAAHALRMGEAYKEIEESMGANGAMAPSGAMRQTAPARALHTPNFTLEPVPDVAPRDLLSFIHMDHGPPSAIYGYKNEAGQLLYVRARYSQAGRDRKGKPKKAFCPWVWKADAWRPEGPPVPRPLYGLERLPALDSERAKSRVIVVEGEKAADALRSILSQPIITWSDGAANPHKTDWRPLAGRRVLLWPDADDDGEKAMTRVAVFLNELRCNIETVDVSGQGAGWDAADAVEAGWKPADVREWLKMRVTAWAPPSAASGGQRELADAGEPPPPPPEEPESAIAQLWGAANISIGKKGPWGNFDNMTRILDYTGPVSGRIELWYDTFLNRLLYRNNLGEPQEWVDTMNTEITTWVQRQWQIPTMGLDTVQRAVEAYAMRSPRNCVQDYLRALVWDGEPRAPHLLSRGFGTVANAYHAAVGRCFLVGMVARAMNPGPHTIVKSLPVFEGPENAKKSAAIRALGGEWYAAIHQSILTSEFERAIAGKWLCEIAEFHSFKGAEMTIIKAKISSAVDRQRLPFGRYYRDVPRTAVFASSTNEDDWNTSSTGASRFWPVRCGVIDDLWIAANRDQLLAEALHRFNKGEQWWDVPDVEARDRQDSRKQEDAWESMIAEYCHARDQVTTFEVLRYCLDFELNRMDRVATMRVANVLRGIGYIRTTTRGPDGKLRKAFRRYPPGPNGATTTTDQCELEDLPEPPPSDIPE